MSFPGLRAPLLFFGARSLLRLEWSGMLLFCIEASAQWRPARGIRYSRQRPDEKHGWRRQTGPGPFQNVAREQAGLSAARCAEAISSRPDMTIAPPARL